MNETEAYAMKGGVIRGYARFIADRQLLDGVKSRITAETLAMLEHPPLASEWVPVRHTIAIIDAVAALRGAEGVREMSRAGLRTTLLAVTMPLVKGLGRMFGLSPATLFSRLQLILKSGSKGFRYEFQPEAEKKGWILVHGSPNESLLTAEAWAAGFELLFEVSAARGKVGIVGVTSEPGGAVMRFSVDWSG